MKKTQRIKRIKELKDIIKSIREDPETMKQVRKYILTN